MRADFMNLSSVDTATVQVESSSKTGDDTLKTGEVFANVMNQSMRQSAKVFEQKTQDLISKADTQKSQTATSSYERYSYKENRIQSAKETNSSDNSLESAEQLEDAKQTIVETICEEYDVSEEEIENLLESMGLSILDLMIPENLADFVVQLTGISSAEELLLDDSYLQIMGMMDTLAGDISKELNLDKNGLLELVSQMDSVTEEMTLPEDMLQSIVDEISTTDEVFVTDEVSMMTEETLPITDDTKEVLESEHGVEVQVETKETVSESDTQQTEPKATSLEDTKEKQENFADASEESDNQLFQQDSTTEHILTSSVETDVTMTASDVEQPQFASYLSEDSMQIMEQVVQQMKVTVSAETTSMEMQLNPENLGKVYVNISSEKGVVNAQFHATNEIVKEVLEAQIASLRENLTQAGVKVDSVDVTIASHEFERNLEQNQQGFEQQSETPQEQTSTKRRNISVDTMDELSGMMTEEELLVAQIMKDNGNSIDFTA